MHVTFALTTTKDFRVDTWSFFETGAKLNVCEWEVKSIILPNCEAVLNEPFLRFKIAELNNGQYASESREFSDTTAIIQVDRPVHKWINGRMDSCRGVKSYGNVNRHMTISLYTADNKPLDLGNQLYYCTLEVQ